MIEQLSKLVNHDSRLVHRGRFVTTTFLLEIDDDSWLISIHDGQIEKVLRGPLIMPRWVFALRASRETWFLFWQPVPPPGYHDLFAMLRHQRLLVEGDQHVFMANLFYFKALLASLRGHVQ